MNTTKDTKPTSKLSQFCGRCGNRSEEFVEVSLSDNGALIHPIKLTMCKACAEDLIVSLRYGGLWKPDTDESSVSSYINELKSKLELARTEGDDNKVIYINNCIDFYNHSLRYRYGCDGGGLNIETTDHTVVHFMNHVGDGDYNLFIANERPCPEGFEFVASINTSNDRNYKPCIIKVYQNDVAPNDGYITVYSDHIILYNNPTTGDMCISYNGKLPEYGVEKVGTKEEDIRKDLELHPISFESKKETQK